MKVAGPVAFFWFRRDLRLDDNAGLYYALRAKLPVIPLFIFDTSILDELTDKADKRVQFIHNEVLRLNEELKAVGSALLFKQGKPLDVWKQLVAEFDVKSVYTNNDHEPYARRRDKFVEELLSNHGASFSSYKDIVIFEKDEVMKDDGTPYTVFTPYSKKWRAKLKPFYYKSYPTQKYFNNLYKGVNAKVPSLESLGFKSVDAEYPERKVKNDIVKHYSETRDYPAINGTTRLGLHLRFGTLSIRKLLAYALERNQTYVNELIWRDFYHQILWHFPDVEKQAFKKQYDLISWHNNEAEFKKWCTGQTGYPLVDAGMRELNETGYMHNRVRMVVASFLTKHLLIDWRWGEAYFAEKLLDFDLAANNGGWQWAAGCGTDAAPYFRIFNPTAQQQRFDPEMQYIKKWVPEYGTPDYPQPMVEHELARKRCLQVYQAALKAEG
ncbi:MAG: deoxyribodipyrimidine photo-lyase [Chitinophagales bacterium]